MGDLDWRGGGWGGRLANMIILWQRRIDHISPSSVQSEQCRLITVRYSGRNVNTRMVKSPLPAAAAVLCSDQLANTWTFTNMLCLPCLSNRISSACTPNWFYRRKKKFAIYTRFAFHPLSVLIVPREQSRCLPLYVIPTFYVCGNSDCT